MSSQIQEASAEPSHPEKVSACKSRNQAERQSVYLGSKSCNSRSTDSGRNSNNALITGYMFSVFMGRREEDEVRCIKEEFLGAR